MYSYLKEWKILYLLYREHTKSTGTQKRLRSATIAPLTGNRWTYILWKLMI